MKLLPLVLSMTSDQGIQRFFFLCESSHFVSPAFHRTAHSILWIMAQNILKTLTIASMVPFSVFFLLSLLSVGSLLPSCPSARVLSSANSSHSGRSFLVILPHPNLMIWAILQCLIVVRRFHLYACSHCKLSIQKWTHHEVQLPPFIVSVSVGVSTI